MIHRGQLARRTPPTAKRPRRTRKGHEIFGLNDEPLLCHRCGEELRPGEGSFYVVRIEAIADPTPPNISAEDLARDFEAELERIFEQMRDVSPQELMDQVYRRMTIHLCGRCYSEWIEDPAGR